MRINKVLCDRCKREIKENLMDLFIDLISRKWYSGLTTTFSEHIELCKNCYKSFERFKGEIRFTKMKGIKRNKEIKGD